MDLGSGRFVRRRKVDTHPREVGERTELKTIGNQQRTAATGDDDRVAMPEMALMAAFIVMAIVAVIRLMMLR